MTKLTPFYKTEEFTGLATDLAVAVREHFSIESDNRKQWKNYLAKTILDSPAYKKYGRDNSDFLDRLQNRIRQELGNKNLPALSRTSIFDALQVFGKYSLEDLDKKLGLYWRWSDALALVGRQIQRLDDLAECNHLCPKHCPKPP